MNTFCAYYNHGICRSCSLLPIPLPEQIEFKEKNIREKLQPKALLPTVQSRPQGFRNKAKLSVTGTLLNPIIGITGQEDLDQGREILNCPIHHPKINEALELIKTFIPIAKLQPYDIKSQKGELKGLILFYSEQSQELYLRFILRSKESLDRIRKNISHLQSQMRHLKVITANIQPIPHALLEGPEEIYFSQETYLHHTLGLHAFDLTPTAFVQTNMGVAEELYQTARDWIQETKAKTFLELFCGQGAFSFFASDVVEKGLGVEINSDAVVRANRTAEKLGLAHLTFIAKDAGAVEREIENFSPDLLLVNPPRRGMGESLEIIRRQKPKYLLYSSCSHETLTSDAEKLKVDYDVLKAQIFDMFPHTQHFETLVLFKLRSIEA